VYTGVACQLLTELHAKRQDSSTINGSVARLLEVFVTA
jgi:hypothetical protein